VLRQRLLQGATGRLTVTFLDGETPVDAGAVTAHVTRDDGTDVLPEGTEATAVDERTGEYFVELSAAATAELDQLTAVWVSPTRGRVTTRADVAGGFYVSLAEIRATKDLDDTGTYPTWRLEQARMVAEDTYEQHGPAFVPRYTRERVDNFGLPMLTRRPVRRLRSIVHGTELIDVAGVSFSGIGALRYGYGRLPAGALEVAYEYGHDGFPPERLRDAMLAHIRFQLVKREARMFDTATTMTADGATFTLAQPGERRPTGIPMVDAVYLSYSSDLPAIA